MIQGIDKIEKEYFDWMYHLVCNDTRQRKKLTYKNLLYYLNSVDFIPILDMDENRLDDGLDFRYSFAYENGYSIDVINDCLGAKNCSVLEMMIALASRVEESITDNYLYGNRTGQWFWTMITNLGLNHMDDNNFDLGYCQHVINAFLNRTYEPDGRGSLFIVHSPYQDMREVDIWCQFMWYLDENFKEEWSE